MFSWLIVLCRLRLVAVSPPEGECEGGGEGDPGEVGGEQQPGRRVHGVELEPARRHGHPQRRDLRGGEAEVVQPEEDRGPGPVESQLSGVQAERRAVATIPVHQVAAGIHTIIFQYNQ